MAAKSASRGRRWSRQSHLYGMLLIGLAIFSPAVCAQEVDLSAPSANPQHRDENGEMLKRSADALTGALTYNSDANAVVAGGIDRGGAYLQRVGLIGDADLLQLVGWGGASAHISVHFINGTGLSALRVGNLLTVSGIEAEPAARLFNLWVEQKLGPRWTLRVGQFTAAQEFAVSTTAALFINSTFGWPASFASDLPSGGPAYPLAAPGIRVAASPREGVVLRLAVFAGDPAGPGSGDPQRRDFQGLNGWRFAGKPFFIGEVSRSAPGDDPAWALTLGGWLHSGTFDSFGADDRQQKVGTAGSTGIRIERRGNWSIYAIADGRLSRSRPRTLRAFVRVAASPADRNPLDLYLDGGLSLAAPFHGRERDTVGIGFAIGRISPRLRQQNRNREVNDNSMPIPAYEAVVEASWQVKIGSHAYVQPNVQLVLNPAAALLDDLSGRATLPSNAVVVGVRTSLRL